MKASCGIEWHVSYLWFIPAVRWIHWASAEPYNYLENVAREKCMARTSPPCYVPQFVSFSAVKISLFVEKIVAISDPFNCLIWKSFWTRFENECSYLSILDEMKINPKFFCKPASEVKWKIVPFVEFANTSIFCKANWKESKLRILPSFVIYGLENMYYIWSKSGNRAALEKFSTLDFSSDLQNDGDTIPLLCHWSVRKVLRIYT